VLGNTTRDDNGSRSEMKNNATFEIAWCSAVQDVAASFRLQNTRLG